MRPTLYRWLAISLLCGIAAHAATRPHYGGTLRVETQAALHALGPANAASPAQLNILRLVADTLTGLDRNAQPVPRLATRWQSENGNKRWQFWLRSGVTLQDGKPLTTAIVAQSLADSNPSWKIRASGSGIVVIESDVPVPEMPAQLARPLYSIFVAGANGIPVGTGPFRIEDYQPGARIVLRANDDYWAGRPYLDEIDFTPNQSLRDQAIHFQLGRADVIDLAPEQVRRTAQEGRHVATSAPVELIAIVFPQGGVLTDFRLRQAISLAIDRNAISNVLLQRQAEPTAALLPQWMSGYAFLFPAAQDLRRARQLRGEFMAPLPPIAVTYDSGDTLCRMVAERIALNAQDAGFTMRAIPANAAQSTSPKVIRIPVDVANPYAALSELVDVLDPAQNSSVLSAASLGDLYQTEHALLEDFRIVPIAELSRSYALGQKVRNWSEPDAGGWPVADVWLEDAK